MIERGGYNARAVGAKRGALCPLVILCDAVRVSTGIFSYLKETITQLGEAGAPASPSEIANGSSAGSVPGCLKEKIPADFQTAPPLARVGQGRRAYKEAIVLFS